MKFGLYVYILLVCSQLNIIAGGLAVGKRQNLEFIQSSGQLKSEISLADLNLKIDFYAQTKFGKILISKNGFSIQVESFFKNDESQDEETLLATNIHLAKSSAFHLVNIEFVNSNNDAIVSPEFENQGYLNFYNTNGRPIVYVKSFKRVIVSNLYPNIDLVFYENAFGELEYDFQVGIGGNPKLIQMKFSYQDVLGFDSTGNLEIITRFNNLIKDKPIAYQLSSENKVDVAFKLNNDLLSFDLEHYDKSKPLTIDPVIRINSSYYGGTGEDVIYRMKLDSKGNQYYAGYTQSVNLIASQNGYQVNNAGFEDAFLAKFDSSGSRVWATYFGGAGFDIAYDIALDNNENPIIAGETNSDSLIATANSHQTAFGGGIADGFVAKFNSNGSLAWATYLGGLAEDKFNGVSCDNFGNIYTIGFTKSDDAIFSGGYQQTRAGKNDAMLIKFNPNGERTWGTYFGGNEDDFFNKVVVGGSDVYAIGSTQSNNLSINNSTNYSGNYDVLLTKFTSNGNIGFSRYFGGTEFDSGNSIAWDTTGDGYVYAIGSTKSSLATTKYAVQSSIGGFYDAAYYGTGKDGSTYVISYFGGESNDFGNDIFYVDNCIYVVGSTISQTGIAKSGYQNSSNGKQEGYFAKINSENLLFGSYFGGNGNDDIRTIAVNKDKYYIAGFTESSSSISAAGAYQTNYAGNADGFFASFFNTKFDLIASGDYCVGQTVPFIVNTNITFNPNTLYKTELSDVAGNFGANPILLATKTSISGNLSFLLSKDILGDSVNGVRFIRIRSTSPEYISNIQKIGINNKLTISKVTTTACVNQAILFSSNSPTVKSQFEWDFGDSVIKTSNNSITMSFSTPGLNKLKLTRTIKNACTEIDSITFLINDGPIYEIKIQDVYCSKSSGTFQVIRKDTLQTPSSITKVSVVNGNNIIKIKEGIYSFNIEDVGALSKILFFKAEVESNCSNTYNKESKFYGNSIFSLEGETMPLIGVEYTYFIKRSFWEEPQNVNWVVDTTFCKTLSKNQDSIKLIFLKNGISSIYVQLIGTASRCVKDYTFELTVQGNDKANFTPRPDTLCNTDRIVFSTGFSSEVVNTWYFYNQSKTITIESNTFKPTFIDYTGVCYLKLVKRFKNNNTSDSIIRKIIVNNNVNTFVSIVNKFCLGINKIEIIPENLQITTNISFIYEDEEILDTIVKVNNFNYNYLPKKRKSANNGIMIYPTKIKFNSVYDQPITACFSGGTIYGAVSIETAPKIEEPEIRFLNGNLETDSANEYLWIFNNSKTITTRSIANPENGNYHLKVKYGDCYSYSSTYTLNRNSIEESPYMSFQISQKSEKIEVNSISNIKYRLHFTNMLGNELFSSNENLGNVSIPIVGLPSGVYLLQLTSVDESIVKKIILER